MHGASLLSIWADGEVRLVDLCRLDVPLLVLPARCHQKRSFCVRLLPSCACPCDICLGTVRRDVCADWKGLSLHIISYVDSTLLDLRVEVVSVP